MSPMPTVTQPTLYRIHPVSFRDGNGDGVGDAHGMIAALPYLNQLSIDGLVLPQPLAEQEGAAVAAQGLALWYCDGPHHIRRAAASQQYLRSPLALEVVPFSVEKLIEVLNARRATLADSLWSTGDADQPRVVSHWGQGNLRSADAFLTLLAMLPCAHLPVSGRRIGSATRRRPAGSAGCANADALA
jgi:hypothetical protein